MEGLSQRQLKEQFVSNLNGTSKAEVALIASHAPLVVLTNIVVCQVVFRDLCFNPLIKFLVDFSTLILPGILIATVFSEHSDVTFSVILLLVAALLLFQNSKRDCSDSSRLSFSNVWDIALTGKRPFLTNFRAYLYIATAVCILAVDFTAFPRRFGKAETYGSGCMDAGVGSFIISNAIVSPEARGKYPVYRGVGQRLHSIARAIKSCVPLLVVGIARTVSVKATDYQQHVSEYGVHWNFFFTLIVVKILATVILCLWNPSWSWLISIAVASGHHYLLNGRGFKRYILHGPDGQGGRYDLISANREGIFSCLGYLSIYFAGVQIGQLLFQHRVRLKEWINAWIVLVGTTVLFGVLLIVVEERVEPISRRMANLTFVLSMIFGNLLLLVSFLLVDILSVVLTETGFFTDSDAKQPTRSLPQLNLSEAVNRNGLFFFLLANLLTGLVNFSVHTMEAPLSLTILVLVGYMFVLSLVAAVFHMWNITLRVW